MLSALASVINNAQIYYREHVTTSHHGELFCLLAIDGSSTLNVGAASSKRDDCAN